MISIKLFELGYIPYIIGTFYQKFNYDISFIKKYTNLIIINNFSEIKRKDFDILLVNSDQTWRKKYLEFFYDFAFLYFARDWKIYKFIYGASLGSDIWEFNKADEEIAKNCLKSFKDISVREIGAIKRIENHFGIKPKFVLDPTFLIDKKYYLNLINNYEDNNLINKNYIFTYIFAREKQIFMFINDSSIHLNYKIYDVKPYHKNSVKKFLYGIYNCKAVITNSYHGTVFSIIFKKPFVSFINKSNSIDRFNSLRQIFKIDNRIFLSNQKPNISLLTTPLNIDYNRINILKAKSIDYLKKNLNNYKEKKKYFQGS